jgi:hypothetical protein
LLSFGGRKGKAPSETRDSTIRDGGDDPFDDCELAPDAIIGIHTFEDVLFTDETDTSTRSSGETSLTGRHG